MMNAPRLGPMTWFSRQPSSNLSAQAGIEPESGRRLLGRFSMCIFALLGVLPFISTIKLPPSPSFWAEMMATVLAGCFLASLPPRPRVIGADGRRMVWVDMPPAVLACGAMCFWLLVQLVARQPLFRGAAVLSILGLVLAALVCLAGARIRLAHESVRLLDVLACTLMIALLCNAAAAVAEWQGIHVYGYRLGYRAPPLRAEGLIGQVNQLGVFAAICGAAANYLWMRGRIRGFVHILFGVTVALLVAACGSRTGLIAWCVGTLGAWTALTGHARKWEGRRLLIVAAVMVVVAQLVVPMLVSGESATVAAARGETHGRYELWRDSWELIKRHPLTGVGYGNFSAARWTELSGSLQEPNATHAHDLIADLAVELGVPAMLMIVLPLAWALYPCLKVIGRGRSAPDQYLAASIATLLAVHALLEYPLWYMFLLIPFALALGLVEQPNIRFKASALAPPLRGAGWVAAGAFCVLLGVDYHRSEVLFTSVTLQLEDASGSSTAITVPLEAATAVNALTFFDVYANLMYSRTLQADGFYTGYKLDIAERAMLTLTNHETIGRRIALLVSAGENDQALALLAKTRRGTDLEKLTREVLVRMQRTTPQLVKFNAALPPLPAVAPVP